jgi:hypothetical protein
LVENSGVGAVTAAAGERFNTGYPEKEPKFDFMHSRFFDHPETTLTNRPG